MLIREALPGFLNGVPVLSVGQVDHRLLQVSSTRVMLNRAGVVPRPTDLGRSLDCPVAAQDPPRSAQGHPRLRLEADWPRRLGKTAPAHHGGLGARHGAALI